MPWLVLLFGLFVRPTWHDEQLWFRIIISLAVVALTALGLRSKRWYWVMGAGSIGLVGFVLWVVMLLGGGHSLSDLMSFETDGVTNLFFLAGSALVFTGGWLGARSTSGQPPPRRATAASDTA